MASNSPPPPQAEIFPTGDGIRCSGAWTLHAVAGLEARLAGLSWPRAGELVIDAGGIAALDTAGGWLLRRTLRSLEHGGRKARLQGLRPEHQALLDMILTHEAGVSPTVPRGQNLLEMTGRRVWQMSLQAWGMLSFLGETALAVARSIAQPSRIRWKPILYNLQKSGFNAMPITGLLAFLLGIVIAYQGAEQLRRYGANIFIADLVGLSMLRELGPLMTAIIVAGRSGSAFAAQIGTMKVTEEIDAMRTIGVSPLEQLVLPKVFALVIALPLLSVSADILGVFGGMVMAKIQLNVGFADFIDRFDDAVTVSALLVGIGKAPIFAAIIAWVGCYQGFQVSGGAESVGRQTTVSVVQSIFLIIVADALFSIAFSWLKI